MLYIIIINIRYVLRWLYICNIQELFIYIYNWLLTYAEWPNKAVPDSRPTRLTSMVIVTILEEDTTMYILNCQDQQWGWNTVGIMNYVNIIHIWYIDVLYYRLIVYCWSIHQKCWRSSWFTIGQLNLYNKIKLPYRRLSRHGFLKFSISWVY